MALLDPLRRRAVAAMRRVRARRTLRRLKRDPDPVARQVAAALHDALRERHSPGARAGFERIEAYRASLADSGEPLSAAGGTVGKAARVASMAPRPGRLLHALGRHLHPRRALEFGTLLGVSASYLGLALRDNGGRLDTVEFNPKATAYAGRHVAAMGLEGTVAVHTGTFEDVVPGLLADPAPLDLAFKDGQHDRAATVGWFERTLPSMPAGAVFLFDDIAWSADMRAAWTDVTAHRRVAVALDLGRMGLVVLRGDGPGASARRYRIVA